MEKIGFVYIWRDRKHNRYYIGSHWGTEDDGYICSSVWMKQAYNKRTEDFKRRILKTNILRELLYEEEHRWLIKIRDEEMGKRYYNLKNKKVGHWTSKNNALSIRQKISLSQTGKTQSASSNEKRSKALKGRPATRTWTEEQRKAHGTLGKGRPSALGMLGKKHNLETINKMKVSSKHHRRGCRHTDETKQKMSESRKGMRFWNNGDVNKLFKNNEQPIGWTKGRIK